MKERGIRILGVAVVAGTFAILGCASAYDQAYQQETQRLEAQERARQAEERAAHAEAQRYAAVVYFDVGSAVIKEGGYRELTWFVGKMRPYPKTVIQVQGFADSTGPDSLNQRLSEERASAVARYLTSQGIEPSRVAVQGFASEFPAASNESTKGRLNNRRVEVTVR
jgi:outer membrane protein OmpA-like peptidoglycan-associated protein